jgi:pimeloyl-ACP methyl ester carboxylesterase
MQVLFVHGMGRSPFSALPLLWRIYRLGHKVHIFWYIAAFQSFASISSRLQQRIQAIALNEPYFIVSHSLGGLLSRQALAILPTECPNPVELVLLGSPVKPALLAQLLSRNMLFRWFKGDCGQLLANFERMNAIPPPTCRASAIVGVSPVGDFNPVFAGEPNDTVVRLSEVQAPWLAELTITSVSHTFLPAASPVSRLICEKFVEESLRVQ